MHALLLMLWMFIHALSIIYMGLSVNASFISLSIMFAALYISIIIERKDHHDL